MFNASNQHFTEQSINWIFDARAGEKKKKDRDTGATFAFYLPINTF